MPSTASDLLKVELQADGENDTTWGQKANVCWERMEEAIAGMVTITLAGTNYTLDDTQYVENSGTTAESHVAMVKTIGTPGATRQVIVPLRTKIYLIWNATTDASSITVGGSSGDTVTITNGNLAWVFCDGTNVEFASPLFKVDGALADDSVTNAMMANDAIDSDQIADGAVDPVHVTGAINSQTGTSYTLVIGDAFKVVTMDNASANTLTVPTNASVAFPVGARIDISMLGAGVTTVQGDTGVTVNGVSAGSGALTQYGSCSVLKLATNTWLVIGLTVS